MEQTTMLEPSRIVANALNAVPALEKERVTGIDPVP